MCHTLLCILRYVFNDSHCSLHPFKPFCVCPCRDETSCCSWFVIGNSADSVCRDLRRFVVAQEEEGLPKEVLKCPLATLRSNTIFFSNIYKCNRLYTNLQVSPTSLIMAYVCVSTQSSPHLYWRGQPSVSVRTGQPSSQASGTRAPVDRPAQVCDVYGFSSLSTGDSASRWKNITQ